MANLMSKAWRVLREKGLLGLLRRISVRMRPAPPSASLASVWDDVLAVDWTVPHPAVTRPLKVVKSPLNVAWIMSPPGISSGGHQNIFRFIQVLEAAGHTVRVYLYGDSLYGPAEARAMVAQSPSYPNVAATFEAYAEAGVHPDTDAIMATSWKTAYPAFRDPSPARRFYFVQDFEPWFSPAGSAAALAENTYRFGFTGITAGRWLAEKLAADFGMETDHFDFGSDPQQYSRTNAGGRDEVLFYARPATQRRGFELGLMALQLFSRERPEVRINLIGEDLSGHAIPFEHVNLSAMQVPDLNAVYNRCSAGLVLSFTNMSLLPLEMLGAGVIPIVNDGENNRAVVENPFIEYAAAFPRALADRLLDVTGRDDLVAHSADAAESVRSASWTVAGTQFLDAFEGRMHG